jgi:hypothetical protein
MTIYDAEGVRISSGDLVELTNPRKSYVIGDNNPAIGTKHACKGIVIDVRNNEVRVAWKNGQGNMYHDRTLTIVSSTVAEGDCNSIW